MRKTLKMITSGEWIVKLVRWLVVTGGFVAEASFLLATLYVTLNNVAHLLLTWLVPIQVINLANQLCVVAFSILPELIAIAAIKITFDHYRMYVHTRRRDSLIWSLLYTIPTTSFVIMTIITLASFSSVEATTNLSPVATGTMLVIRCLSGWFYALIQMLFVQLGEPSYTSLVEKLKNELKTFDHLIKEKDQMIKERDQMIKRNDQLIKKKTTVREHAQEKGISYGSAQKQLSLIKKEMS